MLVSAIMPTRGRPKEAQGALACFIAQTYQNRELIILDDADDPSFTFTPDDLGRISLQATVHYHRLNKRLTIGAKRNLACSRASGEVICHFDDDDYSAPERIADELSRLTVNVNVTGYCSLKFLHVETGEWWKYSGHSRYALGTSLMYRREFWNTHRFPDSNKEDADMCHRARNNADAGEMMWARTHAGNTSKRKGVGVMSEWTRVA